MRSSFQKALSVGEDYVVTGDAHHHLVHVIRIEEDEKILLTNGQGLQVVAQVQSITKKELRLKHVELREQHRSFAVDLALGMPKKEALELCLKQATELGLRKIYLIRSAYSQTKMPDDERIQSLLVSALEQSNAPYLPQVISSAWDELPWSQYQTCLMLDSQTTTPRPSTAMSATHSQLLIVGPEGGFSPEEITKLHAVDNLRVLHLPTPILRSPTALATGVGYVLKSLLD